MIARTSIVFKYSTTGAAFASCRVRPCAALGTPDLASSAEAPTSMGNEVGTDCINNMVRKRRPGRHQTADSYSRSLQRPRQLSLASSACSSEVSSALQPRLVARLTQSIYSHNLPPHQLFHHPRHPPRRLPRRAHPVASDRCVARARARAGRAPRVRERHRVLEIGRRGGRRDQVGPAQGREERRGQVGPVSCGSSSPAQDRELIDLATRSAEAAVLGVSFKVGGRSQLGRTNEQTLMKGRI